MNEQVALEIFRNGLVSVLVTSAPILIAALVVGVTIAIFQSLTQIQEMTLTFVPKIIAVFIALMIFFPWMIQNISQLTVDLITNIPEFVR